MVGTGRFELTGPSHGFYPGASAALLPGAPALSLILFNQSKLSVPYPHHASDNPKSLGAPVSRCLEDGKETVENTGGSGSFS